VGLSLASLQAQRVKQPRMKAECALHDAWQDPYIPIVPESSEHRFSTSLDLELLPTTRVARVMSVILAQGCLYG
jgi:hypothetical protein